MTIQQFIEKAIAGGWTPKGYDFTNRPKSWCVQAVAKIVHKERIFLDLLAWQAVGKTEGWDVCSCGANMVRTDGGIGTGWKWRCENKHWMTNEEYAGKKSWLSQMHRMIDALASGSSIEQYLETL